MKNDLFNYINYDFFVAMVNNDMTIPWQTDLGSSKMIGAYKTKTFVGTPEYLAPEIIQVKGYNRSVFAIFIGFHRFDQFQIRLNIYLQKSVYKMDPRF